MISTRERKGFTEYVIGDDLLSEAISWIQSNLEPEDVFGEDVLEEWALSNGFAIEG